MPYQDRILLPLEGIADIEFYTKSGLLVARGYERVVIGGRGPYIEFADAAIFRENLHIPPDQKWRFDPIYDYVYYYEYRTNDEANVKCYLQQKRVDYADYREGYWYISPFDLTTAEFPVLVKPYERKRK
jgi:hypothetical protein